MKPVDDPVAKVDNELALGEDLAFQRKWWSFERVVYVVFTLIVLLDLAGAFGRGYLAKAHATVCDGAAQVHYDRIQRVGATSLLSVDFAPDVTQNGKNPLWMGDSLTHDLGTQRVIPQPVSSTLEAGGFSYVFLSQGSPAVARFALKPMRPGIFHLPIRIGNRQQSQLRIFVLP